MKYVVGGVLLIVALLLFVDNFIRAIRIVIACAKGDEDTVNRLTMPYDECERIALVTYGCSKELFAQYYKEVRDYNPNALPYDALDFCAWEYDVVNNK